MNLNIADKYFGELLPLIKDEKITDICWNGEKLWIDHLEKGRYEVDTKLSDTFVSTFSQRLSNLSNKNFNMSEPLLEAETDELRISIVHESVTNTGMSISIRKTPAVRRLNDDKMVKDGYAEEDILKLLEMFVKGHCSIIVTGDVGSGKTELVKYLTKFIPNEERTISIEDNFELRLATINPSLDAVEIKAVGDRFNYSMAIKAALRQLCKWLLLSEARSQEVVQLLEAASTGCIVMTTIHSDDVRKLPDRVVNMMGTSGEEKRNDVYNFFDVGIKVDVKKTPKGIKRKIAQIGVMDRENEENSFTLIYDEGFTGAKLPHNTWKKISEDASEEQKNLFAFLKPETTDSDSRYDAKTLNNRTVDKGRNNQAPTELNLTLDKSEFSKEIAKAMVEANDNMKKEEIPKDTKEKEAIKPVIAKQEVSPEKEKEAEKEVDKNRNIEPIIIKQEEKPQKETKDKTTLDKITKPVTVKEAENKGKKHEKKNSEKKELIKVENKEKTKKAETQKKNQLLIEEVKVENPIVVPQSKNLEIYNPKHEKKKTTIKTEKPNIKQEIKRKDRTNKKENEDLIQRLTMGINLMEYAKRHPEYKISKETFERLQQLIKE